MSEGSPAVAPTPIPPSSSLAPPTKDQRPASANSNKSASARKNRSTNSSANVSRSNSHSSRGGAASDGTNPTRSKKSGSTTTISGGTSLGVKEGTATEPKKGKGSKKGGPPTSSPQPTTSGGKVTEGKEGKGDTDRPNPNRKSSIQNRRPTPINTAPPRPTSQNSNSKPNSTTITASQSAPVPKALHAAVAAPKTAMEAAMDAATKKHHEVTGGDALSSLQKMISDLKAMPPSSATSSGGSQPVSRSASGTKDSPVSSTTKEGTSPIAIPGAVASSKKLKADAPSFTPSIQPSSASPVTSIASISPAGVSSPPWIGQQPLAQVGANRRLSNSSANGHGPSYHGIDINSSPAAAFANSLPPYPMYPNQLHVHPEADNEDMSPLSFISHADAQYHQQQLLAAQQLQYQQIQMLQAQIAANAMQSQQQHSQQQAQPMGSFIAPRFQALAAQRAAQQQQQQLSHAQRIYELQQQQHAAFQRQQEEAQAHPADGTMQIPPPVFEEDSPEQRVGSLGPTGRPQLAPTFTFGKKPQSNESIEKASMSPPLINRSEGIGGAAATGLAGLAARAHKRTGSELTPAMQQQVSIFYVSNRCLLTRLLARDSERDRSASSQTKGFDARRLGQRGRHFPEPPEYCSRSEADPISDYCTPSPSSIKSSISWYQ